MARACPPLPTPRPRRRACSSAERLDDSPTCTSDERRRRIVDTIASKTLWAGTISSRTGRPWRSATAMTSESSRCSAAVGAASAAPSSATSRPTRRTVMTTTSRPREAWSAAVRWLSDRGLRTGTSTLPTRASMWSSDRSAAGSRSSVAGFSATGAAAASLRRKVTSATRPLSRPTAPIDGPSPLSDRDERGSAHDRGAADDDDRPVARGHLSSAAVLSEPGSARCGAV